MRIVERTGTWLIRSETQAKPGKVLSRNPFIIKDRKDCPFLDKTLEQLSPCLEVTQIAGTKKGSKVHQLLIKITKLVHQVK